MPTARDVELDVGDDGEDIGATQVAGSGGMGQAAIMGALSAAKARIVFKTKTQSEVVPITTAEAIVGRRRTNQIMIDHDGVSGRHASITFNGRTFFVEDLESKNHTFLDKEELVHGTPRALHGDCHLRFGTVDALLVTERVPGIDVPDAATYSEALEILGEEGQLPPEKVKKSRDALQSSGAHPGIDLIKAGTITVAQWAEAIQSAKVRRKVLRRGASSGTPDKKMMWALVGLVLVLIAIVVWLIVKK